MFLSKRGNVRGKGLQGVVSLFLSLVHERNMELKDEAEVNFLFLHRKL